MRGEQGQKPHAPFRGVGEGDIQIALLPETGSGGIIREEQYVVYCSSVRKENYLIS